MLRREAGLTQQGFASFLEVPLNSFRMWDSGIRSVPSTILERARTRLARHAHASALVALPALAVELDVHVQTLQRGYAATTTDIAPCLLRAGVILTSTL